ncbi:MAG TPA: nuclear transport factor 2 family protein [Pyrinomonadaceae bacterium]
MPAWGKHMEDQYIWDVVAFLRKLPSLSVEQYQAEVAASGGHSHGEANRQIIYKLQRQTGDSSGDPAWVASEATLAGSSDGKPVALMSTETLVLKNIGGRWKVVHIHWSSKSAKAH